MFRLRRMRPRPCLSLTLLLPTLSVASAAPSQAEGLDPAPGQEARTPDVAARVAHRQARLVSVFRALSKALEPVQDKASADAAAPDVLRLTHILRRLREESHRASERGPAAEEAMDAWREKYGKAFAKLTERAFGKALALSLERPACHGSAALEVALSRLFDELEEKGATETEEEEGTPEESAL